jgi:hypothetical protein
MNEKLTEIRDSLKIINGMATTDPADYEWLFVKAMQYFELKEKDREIVTTLQGYLTRLQKKHDEIEKLKLQLSVSESNRKYAENESKALHAQLQSLKVANKINDYLEEDSNRY